MCITLALIILLIIFERVYKKELTKSFVVLYIYGLILKMVYEIAVQYQVGRNNDNFYSQIKEEL